METTVIISRDDALRARARAFDDAVTWVDDCAALESALTLPVRQVLVDLNIEWEKDLAYCISECKQRGAATVIAFLHEHAGEMAIRAHLAGADRVIPQNQLEDEFEALIKPSS